MRKVRLFIDGVSVDLFDDENISITETIQDIRDISKVFTDFSKSFSVPASSTNNKIFKHFGNFTITNGFDARLKKDAVLEINTLPFKKGKVSLNTVKVLNGKTSSYEITFVGNTVNLVDRFGEDTLNDLKADFYSAFDQQYTQAEVLAALQDFTSDVTVAVSGTDVTFADPLCVPLITHTTRLYYDSTNASRVYSNNGTLNPLGGNLNAGSTTSSTNYAGVYFEELKYAIRLHILIKAIENNYGITFSTDFFNTSNTHYHNLFMWLHRKAGKVFDSVINTSRITGDGSSTGFPTGEDGEKPPSGQQDNGTFVSDGGSFTFFYLTGSYNVRTTVTAVSGSALPALTLVVKRNGAVVKEQSFAADSSAPFSDLMVFEEDFVFDNNAVDAGASPNVYQVFLSSVSSVTLNSSTSVVFEITDNRDARSTRTATFNLLGDTTISNSPTFSIQEQLPNIKVLDFLTSLFKMFNLTAFEEDDGTIKVQTLDEFYASSSTIHDLNEYLQPSYSVVPSLPFKEIHFRYDGLESFITKNHEALFDGKQWGTEEYKNNLDEVEQTYTALGNDYIVEPEFEHMKFERILNQATGSATDAQVGWSVDDGEKPYVGKPLLFYPVRVTSGTSIRYLEVELRADSNSNTDITSYIVPSNSQALSASTSTNNINFFNEFNEYEVNDDFSSTLFKKFYSTYIKRIFSKRNRITKLKGVLPLGFIINHSLADKITFKDNIYFINSIKTKLNTGEATLELLNFIRVSNVITVSDTGQNNASDACAFGTNNTKLFYDRDTLLADSVVLFTNESLTEIFDGNAKFYKIVESNQSMQVSSSGVISNLASC